MTLEDLEDWHVALIAIGVDFVVTIVSGLLARPHVDKDGDGKITVNELPKISENLGNVVPKGGSLYDVGVMSPIQVLIESFAFAATYGAITVLACNYVFVDHIPDRFGWIITLWLSFLSMAFMCAFSANGIHVCTGHDVHFVYYGCGYLPMSLYLRLPDRWVVAVVILARLILHTGFKHIVWPKYPMFYDIVPLYSNESGEVKPFCTPEDRTTKITSLGQTLSNTFLIPFPMYEILHVHVGSALCFGGIIGVICVAIFGDNNSSNTVMFALIISLVVSFLYIAIPGGYFPQKWDVIQRYYPRPLAVLSFVAGAGCVAANSGQNKAVWRHSGKMQVLVGVVGHGSHFFGALLFLMSYIAAAKHFGWLRVCQRCMMAGDAGLHFDEWDRGQTSVQKKGTEALDGVVAGVIGKADNKQVTDPQSSSQPGALSDSDAHGL